MGELRSPRELVQKQGRVPSQKAEPPDAHMCGYNGSVPSVESLHQEVSVLVPDPTVSCLDDPSHLPDQLEDTPILSEVSLEPFNTLAPGRLGD